MEQVTVLQRIGYSIAMIPILITTEIFGTLVLAVMCMIYTIIHRDWSFFEILKEFWVDMHEFWTAIIGFYKTGDWEALEKFYDSI